MKKAVNFFSLNFTFSYLKFSLKIFQSNKLYDCLIKLFVLIRNKSHFKNFCSIELIPGNYSQIPQHPSRVFLLIQLHSTTQCNPLNLFPSRFLLNYRSFFYFHHRHYNQETEQHENFIKSTAENCM